MCRNTLGIIVLGVFMLAASVPAQQDQPPLPQPRLMTLFPPGGKAGSTVEVSFTGTDLEEPEALMFSHPGLKAEPVIPPPPPAPPKDPKKPMPAPMPPAKPVITKFKVTIAADAPLGIHDVRLVNKWGVSNPRPFVVGSLNELEEKEPNSDVAQAQKVEVNSTINGSINNPTDVDYFAFSGKKGQRLLLNVAATSIDSRGRPALEVYDMEDKRILFSRNYRDYDALGDVTLPSDGDYLIRLFNFTHSAGSAEHYYRLSLTTGPWIDAIVPPMIEPGKSATVTLYGRNLPGGQVDPTALIDGQPLEKLIVTITAPADPSVAQRLQYSGRLDPLVSSLDGFEYRFRGPNGVSNPYLITFAKGSVVVENDANDRPESAQSLTLPCEVAGRLEKRADRDWYLLTVKKGDVFNIELFADRLGSAGDFFFMLKQADPKAGAMVEQEDTTDSLHPFMFFTRTFDPQPYRFEAPQDGKYWLMVSSRDAGTTYGPQSMYRLRITPEQPDFRLIVMPSGDVRPGAQVLRAGGEQLYDVFVWRQDGFTAPISLSVEGLPPGVTFAAQTIGPQQRQGTLVLSAAPTAPVSNAVLTVKGTATVSGKSIVREARPSTISWPTQQNAPAISRLDRQLVLAVRDKAPFRLTPETEQIKAKQGDKVNIKLKLARLWPDLKAVVNVQAVTVANNQPLVAGIVFNNNQPLAIAADKSEGAGTLTIAQNVPPGTYNLVLRGAAQFQFGKTPTDKKQNVGLVQPSTPITLTVVPTSLGRVSASLANAKVKQGETGELVVKIERQHNFTGEYRVKAVLPPNTTGVTIAEGVVPAGKDEAKLAITIAKDAKPANLQNIVVQAVAQFDPTTPITQETKLATALSIVPTVLGKFTPTLSKPVLKAGEAGELLIAVERQNGFTGEFKLKVLLPPGVRGITIPDGSIPAGQNNGKLPITVVKEAGPLNLQDIAIQATGQFDPQTPIVHEAKVAAALTVIPTSLGKVSARLAKPNLKPGETGELIVQVERQHNFAGEYKVKAVLPANTPGLTIGEGSIAAGKNEVKLIITVAKEAKPAMLQNIVVQAVAQLDAKTPIMQETKLSGLNIVPTDKK